MSLFCILLFHTVTVYNTVFNLNTQQNKFKSYKNWSLLLWCWTLEQRRTGPFLGADCSLHVELWNHDRKYRCLSEHKTRWQNPNKQSSLKFIFLSTFPQSRDGLVEQFKKSVCFKHRLCSSLLLMSKFSSKMKSQLYEPDYLN